jgi:hypothetical protein
MKRLSTSPAPSWPLILLGAWAFGVSALSAQTASDAAPSVLTGTVRGRLDGEVQPVPFARVDLGGGRRSAVANAQGTYVIEVSPGDVELSVEHLGYERLSLRVSVPAGDSVTVDFELTAVPVPLPSVDILSGRGSAAGDPPDARDASRALTEIDLQALDVGPGVGQPGLAEIVSALPGNDPDDATDVLFMRGSTADLKLVLLDGVPVYTPFHVAGLMKSFEQNVLGAAELHVGAAPARFDGGLTHILDLHTRPARSDRLHMSGAVDMLSASAAVETPLGDAAGVILSGRSLHGLGAGAFGGAPPYGYRDLLLSATARPAADHQLRSTAFFNEESVRLDESHGLGDARWANLVSSVGYRRTKGATTIDVTGGLSGYRAELPLQPSARPGQIPVGALLASAETDRVRVVGEVQWGEPGSANRAGLSFESIAERYGARPVAGGPSASSDGSVRTLGAFLDVTRPVARGISVRAGLRADRFGGTDVRLAPRGMVAWEVGPEALLTLSLGRYHQPTRGSEERVDAALADLLALTPPRARLPVATADHIVLGLAQRFSESVRLDIQGFWKGYQGLPSARRETVRSSGADVRIVTAGDGRAAWLGYGLSWFWSSVDLSGTASEFVGRHLLSAGVSGHLIGPLEAEARLAYGAGLPYTSIPFGGEATTSVFSKTTAQDSRIVSPPLAPTTVDPLVQGLDDAFLRLDLEIHAVLEPTWAGRTWRVRPYLRILNALDRRDALFYTFQPWRDEAVTPVAEQPALPLLGVAFSF